MINKMKTEKVCKEIELCHKLMFQIPISFLTQPNLSLKYQRFTLSELKTLEWWISRLMLKLLVLQDLRLY